MSIKLENAEQLPLFLTDDYENGVWVAKNPVIEPDKSSITQSVIEPQIEVLQRFCARAAKNFECHVNQYKSSKCDRYYYRVSWRDGRKSKHLHIPGGSTLSDLAQYRARKIESMIDRGAELAEIIAAVQTYRS